MIERVAQYLINEKLVALLHQQLSKGFYYKYSSINNSVFYQLYKRNCASINKKLVALIKISNLDMYIIAYTIGYVGEFEKLRSLNELQKILDKVVSTA